MGQFLAGLGDDLLAASYWIQPYFTSAFSSENETRDLTSEHMRNHVPRSSGPPSAGTVCLLLLCSCGTPGPRFARGMSAVRLIHDADQAAKAWQIQSCIKKLFILYQSGSGRRRCRSYRARAVFPCYHFLPPVLPPAGSTKPFPSAASYNTPIPTHILNCKWFV